MPTNRRCGVAVPRFVGAATVAFSPARVVDPCSADSLAPEPFGKEAAADKISDRRAAARLFTLQ